MHLVMHRFSRPRCVSPDRGGGKCHHARSCVRTMTRAWPLQRGDRIQVSHPQPRTKQKTHPHEGGGGHWTETAVSYTSLSLLHFVSHGLERSCPQCLGVFLTLWLRLSCVAEISYFSRKSGNLSLNFLPEIFLLAGAFCTTDPDSSDFILVRQGREHLCKTLQELNTSLHNYARSTSKVFRRETRRAAAVAFSSTFTRIYKSNVDSAGLLTAVKKCAVRVLVPD